MLSMRVIGIITEQGIVYLIYSNTFDIERYTVEIIPSLGNHYLIQVHGRVQVFY